MTIIKYHLGISDDRERLGFVYNLIINEGNYLYVVEEYKSAIY